MVGQARIPPTPAGVSLSGKTVVITGANSGLGFEAARQVLQLQASKVILGVRTVSKGEAARQSLLQDALVIQKNPTAEIKVLKLDLSSYDGVIQFVDAFTRDYTELDSLVLNAAMTQIGFARSINGHEMILQVNYLSTALLALLLLPLLQKTAETKGAPSRLTWVSSQAQHYNSIDKSLSQADSKILSYFDDQAQYRSMLRYNDSKVLVSMFIEQLAERIDPKMVVINNLCPGFVQTDIDKNMPLYMKLPLTLLRSIFARTAEEGARTLIFAGEVAGPDTHGKFLADNKMAR
jgi:NAD(P)-dependent dehydrogenase (short-subunit alcohol dehydrogenase family)